MDECDLEPDHGLRSRIAWLLSAHCYALDLAARLKRMGQPRYQRDGDPKTSGPGFGVTLHWDKLGEPARWRKPRTVFVNSMSDLFHPEVPSEFINEVWRAMYNAPQHTFQVLTKRPERMLDWSRRALHVKGWPADDILWPEHIWLGTSIENRRFVHRADLLRETPAAVRFVSAEPLLGPLVPDGEWDDDGDEAPYAVECRHWRDGYEGAALNLTDIDWLICGGESGPKHRPMRIEWARDLRDACQTSGTAFFFKQWGGRTPKSGGRRLDGREWNEMPKVSERVA